MLRAGYVTSLLCLTSQSVANQQTVKRCSAVSTLTEYGPQRFVETILFHLGFVLFQRSHICTVYRCMIGDLGVGRFMVDELSKYGRPYKIV